MTCYNCQGEGYIPRDCPEAAVQWRPWRSRGGGRGGLRGRGGRGDGGGGSLLRN
jgi:hypothetical protein